MNVDVNQAQRVIDGGPRGVEREDATSLLRPTIYCSARSVVACVEKHREGRTGCTSD